MPILNFDSLDAVPEGLREDAKTVDGDTSGKVTVNVVSEKKLSTFRDNNISLSKERDDLKSKLDIYAPIVGENVEEFTKTLQELQVTAQRVKDGELKEGRQLEEALNKRTEELRSSMESRLQAEAREKAAWKLKHDNVENLYRTAQVSAYIREAAMDAASGIEPKALGDVVNTGLGVFKMTPDGKISPFDGDATIYGSDGSSPMTAREWLVKLKDEKPYLYKQTQGGGAGSTTEKKAFGRTPEQIKKMSASELLALANGEKLNR